MFRGKRRLILHFYNVCHIDNNPFTSAFINNSNSYLVLSKLSFNIMCSCVCVCARARLCTQKNTSELDISLSNNLCEAANETRFVTERAYLCARLLEKWIYIIVLRYLELLDKSVERKNSCTFRKSVCKIMYKRRNLIINTINDKSLADYE